VPFGTRCVSVVPETPQSPAPVVKTVVELTSTPIDCRVIVASSHAACAAKKHCSTDPAAKSVGGFGPRVLMVPQSRTAVRVSELVDAGGGTVTEVLATAGVALAGADERGVIAETGAEVAELAARAVTWVALAAPGTVGDLVDEDEFELAHAPATNTSALTTDIVSMERVIASSPW
jgi:hypothetical protein